MLQLFGVLEMSLVYILISIALVDYILVNMHPLLQSKGIWAGKSCDVANGCVINTGKDYVKMRSPEQIQAIIWKHIGPLLKCHTCPHRSDVPFTNRSAVSLVNTLQNE